MTRTLYPVIDKSVTPDNARFLIKFRNANMQEALYKKMTFAVDNTQVAKFRKSSYYQKPIIELNDLYLNSKTFIPALSQAAHTERWYIKETFKMINRGYNFKSLIGFSNRCRFVVEKYNEKNIKTVLGTNLGYQKVYYMFLEGDIR